MTDLQAKKKWLRSVWTRRPKQLEESQLLILFPRTCKVARRWKRITYWLPFLQRLALWHVYRIAVEENV